MKSHGWSFADLSIVAVVDLDSALRHSIPRLQSTNTACVQQVGGTPHTLYVQVVADTPEDAAMLNPDQRQQR